MFVLCAAERENKDIGAEMNQRVRGLQGFSIPAH